MADTEVLGDPVLTDLAATLWTAVRYGLTPGCEPIERRAYSALVLDTAAVARFLREVLGLGTAVCSSEVVDDWAWALSLRHLLDARRHLLEATETELRLRPEARGLRAFRDSLADPELDESAWKEAVAGLEIYLDQEYGKPRGKWVPEFRRYLFGQVGLPLPGRKPSLRLLATELSESFFQVPPASTATERLKRASSQLADIWCQNEGVLEASCETQCRQAQERAERWRRRRQQPLRAILGIVTVVVIAVGVFQLVEVDAWLNRPDVTQAMGEIAKVAERYPGLSISDTFALGEAVRRVLPAFLGYVLLTLTFPWGGMWIERIHDRRLASLREWEFRPGNYVRRVIREGKVGLPAALVAVSEAASGQSLRGTDIGSTQRVRPSPPNAGGKEDRAREPSA